MAKNFKITITALDKTKRGFATAAKGIKAVAGSVLSLKTAIVGTVGAAGIGLLVKSSLDATDSLGKTARKIGATTEALASMRYAASLTGVATATMDMALQRFTRRVAEAAKGTGEAKGALKELRLDASKLVNLPLDKQMQELAGAFEEVETDADKVRLAMKLFDSEGVALVNTLGLGKEALVEMAAEADRLGIALSATAVEGVEDANDSFTRLGALFKGLRDQTVAALAPAFQLLADTIKNKLLTNIEEANGSVESFARDLAVNVLEGVRQAVGGIAELINAVGRGITAIQNKIAEFKAQSAAGDLEYLNREARKFSAIYDNLQKGGGVSFKDRFFLGLAGVPAELEAVESHIEDLLYKAILAENEIGGGEPKVWSDILNLESFNETIEAMKASVLGLNETEIKPTVQNEEDTRSALQKNFDALKKQGEDEVKFAEMTSDQKSKHVASGLATQLQGAAKHSKKLFAVQKAAAIADALVSTYQGAAKAMGAYPPPINFAMAAASIAGGMAQVSAIKAQSFEGGGFTGHGSRSGGLDGKGGFPAILHPNETVIDNTKSSSMGKSGEKETVIVNQTINVTTGIQSTVRAEIANLMPQISEAAENAVLGARLRGGSYSKQLVGR